MQRNIFIILISILVILVLIYFYNIRESVINKEYRDNNINIEYPYFDNDIIDRYLDNYIKKYTSNKNDYLFIDYDYANDVDNIYLTLYIYKENMGVSSINSSSFLVDVGNRKIYRINRLYNTSMEYDFYKQEFIDRDRPMIALTFDDGPNYVTLKVLDILEKYNVKATFFVLGCNINNRERIIERMNDLDMEIGNHMYSHKLLSKLSDNTIKKEIKRVDNLVFDIIGKKPNLIRPSYGSYSKKLSTIDNRNIIMWSIDTLDWKYHNSRRIANKVINKVRDGDIILMHDIYNATANSLEIIIPNLLDKGYQFVKVSDLLYYKGKSLNKIYNRG